MKKIINTFNSLNGTDNSFKSKSRFVQNTGLTLFSNLFVGVSGLIVNSIIGIYYGPTTLGVFSQSFAIYQMLSLIANFGLQNSGKKYASQFLDNLEMLKNNFSSLVVFNIVSSLVVIVLYKILTQMFGLFSQSSSIIILINILIYGVPLFAINKSILAFFAGLRKVKIYSSLRVFRWVVILIGLVNLCLLKSPLEYIAYLFVLSEFLISFYLIFKFRHYLVKPKFTWIKKHFEFGTKSFLSNFIANFNTKIPLFFIGYFLGNNVAGYYSFIEVFAFSVMQLSASVQLNFNTEFTRLWYQKKFLEIQSKLIQVRNVLGVTLIPIYIGVIVGFLLYTYLIMPSDYLSYWPVLAILMIGVAIRYLFGPFFTVLTMAGYLNYNLIRTTLYTIITTILIGLGTKYFGIYGVAIGYSLAMLCNLFILEWAYKEKLNLSLFKMKIE